MNNIGTKELKTEHLLLRKIVPDDAEMVFRWMSDPEVCKYERFKPHPNVEYSRGYIYDVFDYSQDDTYQWGIEADGRLVGSVSIVNVDTLDQKAVMGYALARDCWGRGYMTEAVKAVLHFMFCEVGINRIEASHSINNPGSGKVLEKVGLNLEGFAKEYYMTNVGLQDSKLYGLTRKEYLELSHVN